MTSITTALTTAFVVIATIASPCCGFAPLIASARSPSPLTARSTTTNTRMARFHPEGDYSIGLEGRALSGVWRLETRESGEINVTHFIHLLARGWFETASGGEGGAFRGKWSLDGDEVVQRSALRSEPRTAQRDGSIWRTTTLFRVAAQISLHRQDDRVPRA